MILIYNNMHHEHCRPRLYFPAGPQPARRPCRRHRRPGYGIGQCQYRHPEHTQLPDPADQRGHTQSTLDTPQAVQSVTPQTLADKQVKSLAEAVSTVSGVVESNTLAGIQDSFTRRGFGERNDGSILRDGVRSYLMSNFDATTESVEVLKGPASLLYGIRSPAASSM
jgi:outer membrane receptor for monomeric catechols